MVKQNQTVTGKVKGAVTILPENLYTYTVFTHVLDIKT